MSESKQEQDLLTKLIQTIKETIDDSDINLNDKAVMAITAAAAHSYVIIGTAPTLRHLANQMSCVAKHDMEQVQGAIDELKAIVKEAEADKNQALN